VAGKAIKGLLVDLSNRLTRWRGRRVPASSLLVLLPRCLQFEDCGRAVQRDLGECRRCGRCSLAGILGLCDRYGFRTMVAAGGRQAAETVKDPAVRAVVAVACEQELFSGVLGTLPKTVYAIRNQRPCGPCRNTAVDLEAVEAAVKSLITEEADDEHTHP